MLATIEQRVTTYKVTFAGKTVPRSGTYTSSVGSADTFPSRGRLINNNYPSRRKEYHEQ